MITTKKRGQAAMEFLMTYGWAILAAIVAIGVLAYFGVFNPGRLAGPTGVISPPLNIPVGGFNIQDNIACPVTTEDCIIVQMTQSSGQSIDIWDRNSTIVLTNGGSATCYGTLNFSSWTSGTSNTQYFRCGTTAWAAGAAIAGNLQVRYTTTGTSIIQAATGNVRAVSQ